MVATDDEFRVGMCTGDGTSSELRVKPSKKKLGARVRQLLSDEKPDLWVVTEAGYCFGDDDWKTLGFGYHLSPELLPGGNYQNDKIALLWNNRRYDDITDTRLERTRQVEKAWNRLAKVAMVKLREKVSGRELWLLGAHLTQAADVGSSQLAQLEALADILHQDAAAVILCADLNRPIKSEMRYKFNNAQKLAAVLEAEGKRFRYYYDGLPSFVPNIEQSQTAESGLIDNILHHKVSQLSLVQGRVIEEIRRKGGVLNHNPIAVQFAWKPTANSS